MAPWVRPDVSSPPMARKSRAERARQAAAFRRRPAALVPPPRPRPSLAPHPRSLSHRGVGIHAPADPGVAGGGVLPPLPGAVSHHSRARGRAGGGGAGELGRAGLLPPGGQPAPAGAGGGGPSTPACCRPIPAALERLPGVGRYTAGAVACFAYERVAATVDTNVARVIRRVFHPRLGGRALSRQVWATALEILPTTREACLGGESGDDGAGRADLYGESGEMRRLPGAKGVPYGTRTCHPERSEGDIAAA